MPLTWAIIAIVAAFFVGGIVGWLVCFNTMVWAADDRSKRDEHGPR